MRWRHQILVVVVFAAVITMSTSKGRVAADGGCDDSGSLYGATVHCVKSGSETNAYIASHSDHTYSIRPACEVGGSALCDQPGTCNIGGHDGNLFNV